MRKNTLKMRFFIWYAMKILKAPYFLNFTNPAEDNTDGLGFAWTPEMAERMRGGPILEGKLREAQARISLLQKGDRRTRRMINRAAKREAEKLGRK